MRTGGKFSLHTEEAASRKVWGFCLLQANLASSQSVADRSMAHRARGVFCHFANQQNYIAKATNATQALHRVCMQNWDSGPFYRPVTSNESESTGYNVNS